MLVEADEEDGRVVLEAGLRAVAVVDVEVDDRDAPDAVVALQVAGGDRDVGEEAESHRPVGLGVVARRADGGEGATRLAGHHASQQRSTAPAASRAASKLPARPACRLDPARRRPPRTRVGRGRRGAAGWTRLSCSRLRVPASEARRAGRRAGSRLGRPGTGERVGRAEQARFPQCAVDHPQAVRPFRVVGARVVLQPTACTAQRPTGRSAARIHSYTLPTSPTDRYPTTPASVRSL